MFGKKLAEKGLILILVPTVIQIVLLGQALSLLEQAEVVGRKDSQFKEVTGRLNWVGTITSGAIAGALASLLTADSAGKNLFEYCKKQMPNELDGLTEAVETTPTSISTVYRARTLIDRIFSALDSALSSPISRHRDKVLADLPVAGRELIDLRHQLLQEQSAQTQVHGKTAPAVRSMEKSLITLLIALDAGVAALFFFAFSKGIANRLKVMTENTVRFGQGHSLLPESSGSDEVSNLDKSFHRMADDLIQANQRKQEYVTMITHDLRTPLNSVSATLEILQTGVYGDLSQQSLDLVSRARSSLSTVLLLINQLLEIEKLQSGTVTPDIQKRLLLSSILTAVDAVTELSQRKRINITTPATDIECCFDQIRIEEVLINLLGNAVKFSDFDTTIAVSVMPVSDGVQVMVSDQGRGVPEDMRETIFERFKQVDPSSSIEKAGSGLGLAICKAIIESHGGSIGVKSREPVGSSFWFKLPLS